MSSLVPRETAKVLVSFVPLRETIPHRTEHNESAKKSFFQNLKMRDKKSPN